MSIVVDDTIIIIIIVIRELGDGHEDGDVCQFNT